ncbi:MAG: glycosyltransferase [Flavobacteriales bacterium]|nr:glycosyltransferase [Flavobacteriales bacterium]
MPYPLNEGGTIGIYNYTRGFSESGCDVTLIALAADKHKINLDEAKTELSKYCQFLVYPINTDVHVIPAFLNLFSSKSYNVERFYSKHFEQELIKLLNENQYDIIQIEGTFPAVYSDTIFKYAKSAKVVLRQHNVEFQIWQRLAANAKNPIKKWYLNLLSRRLENFEKKHLNQYAALVPVTEDDGNLFKKMGCKIPVFASPAGINTEVWKPTYEQENPYAIFHIGSLEWLPNLEAVMWFLDEVWPHILQKTDKISFFVAGKGMPENLKNLKLKNVEMVGEVDSATAFVADKAITVVPLKSGSGIRLKILEAMSAGKVVISTTIGAQGINYSENENILIADTPEAFAQSLINVVEDNAYRKIIQQNARQLIENQYSNKSVVAKLLDFYKTI